MTLHDGAGCDPVRLGDPEVVHGIAITYRYQRHRIKVSRSKTSKLRPRRQDGLETSNEASISST